MMARARSGGIRAESVARATARPSRRLRRYPASCRGSQVGKRIANLPCRYLSVSAHAAVNASATGPGLVACAAYHNQTIEGAGPRSFRESDSALARSRSEEHTSELQSRGHIVCRLMLEKKK